MSPGAFDEFPEIVVRRLQVFFSEIHHVPASISFETHSILQLSALIELPHRVFGIEIGRCPVVEPGLEKQVQIRIFGHSLAQIIAGVVVSLIPGPNRSEHVVFDVGFELELFPDVIVDRRGKGMQPGG